MITMGTLLYDWLQRLFSKPTPVDEFIKLLESTPRTWELMDRKRIRTGFASDLYHCPLTAVAHHLTRIKFKLADYSGAAQALVIGLSRDDARQIAEAADVNQGVLYNKRLRRRLLKACGLKETA